MWGNNSFEVMVYNNKYCVAEATKVSMLTTSCDQQLQTTSSMAN